MYVYTRGIDGGKIHATAGAAFRGGGGGDDVRDVLAYFSRLRRRV